MDITGMTSADFHIIPVSKEIEQKVRDRVFENMKYRYGMTGTGNEYGEMVHSYLMSIPAKDRRDAAYTIDQIHFGEVKKINAFVKSRVPGWQPGQSFDTSILEDTSRELWIGRMFILSRGMALAAVTISVSRSMRFLSAKSVKQS